jgi:hypothetical protein
MTDMSTRSYTKTRFSAYDAALLLSAHRSGIMRLGHDYPPAEFRNNVIAFAKPLKGAKLIVYPAHLMASPTPTRTRSTRICWRSSNRETERATRAMKTISSKLADKGALNR